MKLVVVPKKMNAEFSARYCNGMTFLTYGKHIGLPEKHSGTCEKMVQSYFSSALNARDRNFCGKFSLFMSRNVNRQSYQKICMYIPNHG